MAKKGKYAGLPPTKNIGGKRPPKSGDFRGFNQGSDVVLANTTNIPKASRSKQTKTIKAPKGSY